MLLLQDKMSFPPRKVCCDPLKRHRVAPKRGLRLVTFAMYPSLGLTLHQYMYICTDCRKELKTNHEQLQAASSSRDSEDEVLSTCTSTRTPTPPALDINDDQACHGLTDEEASDSSSTGPSSAQKTQTDPIVSANDGDEMVKEKYNSSTLRSERMRILTLLPRSWSIRKAANVFGVSKYLIRQAN